jgi:hypothetical protein
MDSSRGQGQGQFANNLLPQNTWPPRDSPLSPRETNQLRTDVETLLKDSQCRKFIEALLNQMKSVTGTAAYSTNALGIFDAVEGQGGFGRRQGSFTAEGGNAVGGRRAFININYNISSDSSNPFIRADSGRTIVHELLHVGSGSAVGYSHFQMALAAYEVAGAKGAKPANDGSKATDLRNANYFDSRLFDACHVR